MYYSGPEDTQLFVIDTGPHKREKYDYRKPTGPCKLKVKAAASWGAPPYSSKNVLIK